MAYVASFSIFTGDPVPLIILTNLLFRFFSRYEIWFSLALQSFFITYGYSCPVPKQETLGYTFCFGLRDYSVVDRPMLGWMFYLLELWDVGRWGIV